MKNLFISDLDGTLLDSNAEISDRTCEVLNKLIDNGLNFTIATARAYTSVSKIMSKVNLKLPCILMNGVLIYDVIKQKYIRKAVLSSEVKSLIIRTLHEMSLPAFMYTVSDNRMMSFYEQLATPAMQDSYNQSIKKYHKLYTQTDDFSTVFEDTIYFTLIDTYEKLLPLYEKLGENGEIEMTFYNDVYTQGLWYLEIFSSNASKKLAADFLREKYHAEKITAFGDNLNDLPLFEAADFTCAVENANEKIKQKADICIAKNTQNGVAEYLQTQYTNGGI